MSWRDSTPQPVQEDLDELLDSALRAAQHLLEKHGEFYPFAVTLDEGGGTAMAAVEAGGDEHPPSQAVLDTLHTQLARNRERLKGVAFVAPVTTEIGDAVLAELEHRDGGPGMEILMPYARKRLRRSFEYGDLSAGPAERRIWP